MEHGAEGSLGRKRAWGEREYGAEGRLGRKGVWGGRETAALGTPPSRHTNLHFDPQATTFLSPPGGITLFNATKSFVVVIMVVLLLTYIVICDNSKSLQNLEKSLKSQNFASCAMESQSLDFGFG